MPRHLTPLVAPDLSHFARALGRAWAERHAAAAPPPGHVELLNLIARAAGHRNVQALKAAAAPGPAPATAAGPAAPPAAVATARAPAASAGLSDNARKTLMQFDDQGRLQRWPTKFTVQRMAMWVLWTHFAARRVYTEREVNAILKAAQTFGDHVTLRRELINHRLLTRKSDCSEYRKLPARPDDDIRALIEAWRARVRQAGGLTRRHPAPPP
jgi:hypothetical protein